MDDRTNELIFDSLEKSVQRIKKKTASVETLRQAEVWGSSRNKQGHWLKHSVSKRNFQGDALTEVVEGQIM